MASLVQSGIVKESVGVIGDGTMIPTTTTGTTSSKKSSGMGCGRPGYITCSICSATKYYSHVQRRFGRFSCEPCSKFMKRFLRDPKKFTCYESGQCLIGRPFGEQEPRGVSVSRCKACWLKICLDKFTIEPSVRELINSHYLPVFHGTNGGGHGGTSEQIIMKPMVPMSGLYAPGTAILLGQNHNLADLPVIPIPVRKRKVKGQEQSVKGQKCVGGKNGPPLDHMFDTVSNFNNNNSGQQLMTTISSTSDLIRCNLSNLSPTSLSSSTSVNSLPGSVKSTTRTRRSGPTSVKYKKCGNKVDPTTGKTKVPIKRNTIKAINHDIDDNVFRPIHVGGIGTSSGKVTTGRRRKESGLNIQQQQLIVTDQTTIIDPAASLLVYGDHDYGTSSQSHTDDLSHHLTTDEDDEVEGHFSDDVHGGGQWSSKQQQRTGRRSDEEDYEEEDYDEDDYYDDHTDDDDDDGYDDHHGNGNSDHEQHRKRKRRKNDHGNHRKVGGAKRGLSEILSSHQDGKDMVMSLDPVTLSKTPVILVNRADTNSPLGRMSPGQKRRIDPESPKAATRVEDLNHLNCNPNHGDGGTGLSDHIISGSNTDQLSMAIGSMVDLTSDFPKSGNRGKNKSTTIDRKTRKLKSDSHEQVTNNRISKLLTKVNNNPVKRRSKSKKLLTNQNHSLPSSSSSQLVNHGKYVDESDLFEDENDGHNVNHNQLMSTLSSNHGSHNHQRNGSLWTLVSSSSSPPDHDIDDQDGSMIDDDDDDKAMDEDEKYYRELLDPTLRDYVTCSRESSLLFDEILNTNSPFL